MDEETSGRIIPMRRRDEREHFLWRQVIEVLGQGDWADRQAVLKAAAKAVGPGEALEASPAGRTENHSQWDMLDGARQVAGRWIDAEVRRGTLQSDGERLRLAR